MQNQQISETGVDEEESNQDSGPRLIVLYGSP